MSERSMFFNSFEGDRKYTAAEFNSYFAMFIGNGIYWGGNYVKVNAKSGMDVNVEVGNGFINGYAYINENAPKTLTVESSNVTMPRIDRVVLRLALSQSTRHIIAAVKKGEPSNSPVAPTLQRDDAVWELGLADIRVNAGAVSITQSNITDLRLDKAFCGVVVGLVEQPDLTTIYNQYQTALTEFIAQSAEEQARQSDEWQAQFVKQQTDWNTWFATINVNLQQYVQFNFDNLAALPGVTILPLVQNGNLMTETMIITGTDTKVAEIVTDSTETGFLKETETVFSSDGTTILRQATMRTNLADGSVSVI